MLKSKIITKEIEIMSCDNCEIEIPHNEQYQTCAACFGDFCYKHYSFVKFLGEFYCSNCLIIILPITDEMMKLEQECKEKSFELYKQALIKCKDKIKND